MGLYDLDLAEGKTQNKICIIFGTLTRTIVFKSGGILEHSEEVTAAPNGGVIYTGQHDPDSVEGEVTVSKELADELRNLYTIQNDYITRTATVLQYSRTDKLWLSYPYGNCTIKKWVTLDIPEMGGEVELKLSFSLNDLNRKLAGQPVKD